MIVKLDKETVQKCRDFANKRAADSSNLYRARGELSKQKIFADIFYGTLAEFAVASMLENCTQPDLTIYETRNKSFSKDLKWNGLNLHVKSQGENAAARYGLSWVFQVQDSLVTAPSTEDYIVACTVLPGLDVQINGIIPAKLISWKPLRVPSYQGTKIALYWADHLDIKLELESFKLLQSQSESQSLSDQQPKISSEIALKQ